MIAQQVESGNGVAQFCRDNQLNSKSFYNNRAKLSTTQTTAFVKVHTQIIPAQVLSLAIGEVTLDIPIDVDVTWLAMLLRELT